MLDDGDVEAVGEALDAVGVDGWLVLGTAATGDRRADAAANPEYARRTLG